MRNKLFKLEDHLSSVKCEVDKIESAEMFLDSLLQSLEKYEYKGVAMIPLNEMLVKTRGIYHLLLDGERKLTEGLELAENITEELKEAEKKA